MKNFTKKLFSTFLAVAMVFSLFSVSASAQTPEETNDDFVTVTVVPVNGGEATTYNLPVQTDGDIIPKTEGITPYAAAQQKYTFRGYVSGMTSSPSIAYTGDRLTSHIYVGPSSLISFVKVSLVREYWYGSQEIVYTHVPVNTESILFFSNLHISALQNYHITVAPNVAAPSSPALVIVSTSSFYGYD